jgi:hypothetical protein
VAAVIRTYRDEGGTTHTLLLIGRALVDDAPGQRARCLALLGEGEGLREARAVAAEYLRHPRRCRLADESELAA